AIDHSDAVGNQPCDYQRCASTEIGSNDGGAAQTTFSRYNRSRAVDANVRAHTHQFARVHEPVFENVFGNDRSPNSLGHQGHVLRLHVGREPWILLGDYVSSSNVFGAADRQAARTCLNLDAAFTKFFDDTGKMERIAIDQLEF